MNLIDFLKDKIYQIILIVFAVITIELFLSIYDINIFIIVYIPVVIFLMYTIGILIEFYKKKSFYDNTLKTLEQLDQKYLICEIINKVDFIEGKIFKEILSETNKSMIENIGKYKYSGEEYKDYIEAWIHEIKLPIAASKMVIENNKTEVTKSINEELDKIENYTEQALFYARSNTVEKDYCIKEAKLIEIVNSVVKRNKNILIQEKIKIDIEDIKENVFTDSKWCIFILNQIIGNCIKYMDKENKIIKIRSKLKKEAVILMIGDNGIGIKKEELSRVFDKGFTGTNGRIINKKSTGIGLYLSKKLCDKLGLGIEVDSIQNDGTNVFITFPKNRYMELK